jgi:ribosomal protein L11 methyltransferase
VVAANIFPNVLIELAPELAAAVRSGGVLVASGSVVARAEGAADAVCAAGLGLEGRRQQDGWAGMVFRKS